MPEFYIEKRSRIVIVFGKTILAGAKIYFNSGKQEKSPLELETSMQIFSKNVQNYPISSNLIKISEFLNRSKNIHPSHLSSILCSSLLLDLISPSWITASLGFWYLGVSWSYLPQFLTSILCQIIYGYDLTRDSRYSWVLEFKINLFAEFFLTSQVLVLKDFM